MLRTVKHLAGDDGIIPEFLKRVACEISIPLAILYNKSVTEGMVPKSGKELI